jgi:hypothetical protein
MDSPNPDSSEEWFHTNTQLFNTIDDHNRFKIGEGVSAYRGFHDDVVGFDAEYTGENSVSHPLCKRAR